MSYTTYTFFKRLELLLLILSVGIKLSAFRERDCNLSHLMNRRLISSTIHKGSNDTSIVRVPFDQKFRFELVAIFVGRTKEYFPPGQTDLFLFPLGQILLFSVSQAAPREEI